MKVIIIAKCEKCQKPAMAETTSQSLESSHSLSWFYKTMLDLYYESSDKLMCATCRDEWKKLLNKQEDERKNFVK